MNTIQKDPINMLIAGVGGQGNIRMAELIGTALIRKGYFLTIGDTLGAAQRGGSVISHIRISGKNQCSPFILEGRADVILGMEPVETLRMLEKYGNPGVVTITNPRPIYPIDVLSGKANYPEPDMAIRFIKELSANFWLVNAADEALKLGNPILANVILIGALIGTGILPLDKELMVLVLRETFPGEFEINIMALNKGIELIK